MSVIRSRSLGSAGSSSLTKARCVAKMCSLRRLREALGAQSIDLAPQSASVAFKAMSVPRASLTCSPSDMSTLDQKNLITTIKLQISKLKAKSKLGREKE